jgi:ribokinase
VAGSLNLDLVASVPRFPGAGETITGHGFRTFPGGKGANQACAAGKLGARVAMIGRLGRDAAADALLASLAAAGVGTELVARDPDHPSGTAIIAVDASRENRIIVVPGANGAFTPEALAPASEVLREAACVLLQLEIPLATVVAAARLARAGKAIVILDPAPAGPLPDALFADVDYLTPNLGELATLSGAAFDEDASLDRIAAAARLLVRRGARRVIAKLGARGALLVTELAAHHWPPFPVTPVDTTAAGDAFNAAFAVALVAGETELDAGVFASAAAACSVTRSGAQASLPSREEVEALRRTRAAG